MAQGELCGALRANIKRPVKTKIERQIYFIVYPVYGLCSAALDGIDNSGNLSICQIA